MQETKRKIEDAVRINKYLSQAGICSRRQADTYVEEGRVEVDGEVAVSGTKVLPGQSVTFDGKPVKIQEDLIFLAFHKPRGIVCTASKEEKDNILRAEIVVQRDGLPSGRALFKCDVERQRCTEFTREQRKQYDEVYGSKLDEQFKKNTNPDADSKKRERTTGDI